MYLTLVDKDNFETGAGLQLTLTTLLKTEIKLALKHDFSVGDEFAHRGKRSTQYRDSYITFLKENNSFMVIGTPQNLTPTDVNTMIQKGTMPVVSFAVTVKVENKTARIVEFLVADRKDYRNVTMRLEDVLHPLKEKYNFDSYEVNTPKYYQSKEGFVI